MPTVSPLPIARSTCCTARTVPRRVANSTERSDTSSSGSACVIVRISDNPRESAGPILDFLFRGNERAEKNSRPPSRIDDVAQPVAQKIEAEHGHHQRGTGEKG